jgi:hypothetical protein
MLEELHMADALRVCDPPKTLVGAALLLSLNMTWGVASAQSCDEFAGRLIANAVRPSIEALGCAELRRAGLDRSEHRLHHVCYSSSGATSNLEIVADLKCRTGDKALIPAQGSERVTARVRVRAADCQITQLNIDADSDIGRMLLQAFDAEGKARQALQKALQGTC